MSARLGNFRTWIALAFAIFSVTEVGVLALRAAGVDARFALGSLVLSIHSLYKPLWLALCASAVALLAAPASRAWRVLVITLMAAAIALAIVAQARVAPAVVTKADIAVTELYVQLASEGRLLEGPYSRFGWHHPGPLYFWLQVPFYELSGERGTGLYAGALALNFAALAMLAWVLLRTNGGILTIGVLAGWLLFAWRDRFTVASPWTGHIPVIPTMTFVALAAAVAAGRRWMLPPLVFFGSLMTQSHVSLIPVVGVLTMLAVGALIVGTRESATRPWAALHVSAWLLAILWLPSIAEQLAHEPGNLARLWTFFVGAEHAGKSFSTALAAWSYALAGALRPDLYTPYGGHFDMPHLAWAMPVAAGQVAGLAIVVGRARHDAALFEARVALMALVASLVALWSITRIQGDIVDHEIFWLTPLGAMNLGIIAAAAVRRTIQTIQPWVPRPLTVGIVTAVLLACIYTGFRDFDRLIAFESNRPKDRVIAVTYDSIRNYLSSRNVEKPLFRIPAAWDVAAGVLLRLHTAGTPFSVEDSSVIMFTEQFATRGDEDAVITIGDRASTPFEGNARETVVVQPEPVYVEAYGLHR